MSFHNLDIINLIEASVMKDILNSPKAMNSNVLKEHFFKMKYFMKGNIMTCIPIGITIL